MMKKWVVLLTVLVLAVVPVYGVTAQTDAVTDAVANFAALLPEQGYGVLTVDDFSVQLIDTPLVLLDVREVDEYTGGHVPESFNVPIRTLGQNLTLLPNLADPIVVICKGGARAMLAATALRILGYEDVRVLAGGYDAWVGAEFPVTTDAFVPELAEAPALDPEVLAAVDTFLSTLPQGFGLVNAANLSVELVDNPPILLDVRSAEEWATGYIEGAQHIWINEFLSRRDQWPADLDANIVIYCTSGYRGGIATVMMELLGYTNVRNLSGGLNGWINSGLPLAGVPAQTTAFDLETALADYLAGLPNTFNAVRPADLAAELAVENDLVLVDVRSSDEYAEGFIEGAINIPLQELTAHLDMLPDLDANIVVYCGSGHRSALAMTALNLLGYTRARSMISGTNAWTSAGNPLSTELPVIEAGTRPAFDPELLALVEGFITAIPTGYYVVRAPDLSVELIENPPALIDVRTDSEWEAGRIEGAVHISLRDFFANLDQLPADMTTPVVLYDNPTHRSSIALAFLRLLGYENVRVLGGGTGAWTNAGLELVTE